MYGLILNFMHHMDAKMEEMFPNEQSVHTERKD